MVSCNNDFWIESANLLYNLIRLSPISNANLLLLGYTHVPFHSTLSKGAVTNPGSVGQPRDGNPSASYAKLDILNGKIKCEIERISYDVESAASRIVECGLPTFLAERLFIGV
jgi:predicted phosphodiesterase